MGHIMAFLSGLVFSLGLVVSGMINPARVLGFLDVLGEWDPTLLFVMGAAVIVYGLGLRVLLRRRRPLFAGEFSIPTRRDIDLPLVAGAAVFGIGWGLVGLCPGPALGALSLAPGKAAIFVASMLAGMLAIRILRRPRSATGPGDAV